MSRSRRNTERWHIKRLKAPIVLRQTPIWRVHVGCLTAAKHSDQGTIESLQCVGCMCNDTGGFSISVQSLLRQFIQIRSIPHNLSESRYKLVDLKINPERDAIVHIQYLKDTRNSWNHSGGTVEQFNAAVYCGTSLVSRDIVLMRTNVINLLNRAPEHDSLTFFVLHRMKCTPMHLEWERFFDVTLTLTLNPNPNCNRNRNPKP